MNPTAYEQVMKLLPQLSAEERGRLRHLLVQSGNHRPMDPRRKVATNVMHGAK